MQQQYVRDWMSPTPKVARPDTSAFEAYDMMQQSNIRRLPVVEQGGRLVGIITRSDIEQAMPSAHSGQNRRQGVYELAGTEVADLMTRDPLTVQPDSTIRDAAAVILNAKVSGLPVVEAGKLVGIITESDIFRLVVSTWSDKEEAVGEAENG